MVGTEAGCVRNPLLSASALRSMAGVLATKNVRSKPEAEDSLSE